MFRRGKNTESKQQYTNNKVDRYEEMINQQKLIESKKQEIQARIDERKRQEVEGARKKLSGETLSGKKTDAKLLSSKLRSWKSDDRWRKKPSPKLGSTTDGGKFVDKTKESIDRPIKNSQYADEFSASSDGWDIDQFSNVGGKDSRSARTIHNDDLHNTTSTSSIGASDRYTRPDPPALLETSPSRPVPPSASTPYPCGIPPVNIFPTMPSDIVHPPMPPFIPNFLPCPPVTRPQFLADRAPPPMPSANNRFPPSYNSYSVPPPINRYNEIPDASYTHFGRDNKSNVSSHERLYLNDDRSLQTNQFGYSQDSRKSTEWKSDRDEYTKEKVFKGSDVEYDNRLNDECMEEIADIVAGSSDEVEEIILNDNIDNQLFWFLKDKKSKAYAKYREIVEKKRKTTCEKKNEETVKPVIVEKVVDKIKDEKKEDKDESEDKKARKRKKRSRWEDAGSETILPNTVPGLAVPSALGQVVPVTVNVAAAEKRNNPALMQYALKSFGTVNLSEEDWKKAEDHYKINLLYQDMLKKREEIEKLQAAGKVKYEYDSDEDTEGGTWEHKLRMQEMTATQLWADELTDKAQGKHHIGDFLPPDELKRFMEKYDSLKEGREPDLSDYKEFKLKEDNIGFQMLQKLGWSEGQGLGADGSGIVNPVNKAATYMESHGLGVEKPSEVTGNEDEYDAYRKRMMLAYRFRPNPLNNPRRPYY